MKTPMACLALAVALLPGSLDAQLDGARVNWPLPKNMNVLAVHRLAGTANATLTNLHRVEPTLDIENELYLLTYSRSQPVFDRSAVFTLALPAGVVRADQTAGGASATSFVHGVGDPSLGVTINLYGAPGLMLREYMRYEPGTIVTFGVQATFPWGQYEGDQLLNVGGNRSRIRLSLPLVRSLTAWVPGNRTTLEVVPSVTFLGDNDDRAGLTVDQDPMAAVEAHLSRDITRRAFLSADYTYLRQGESVTSDPGSGATVGTSPSTETHLVGATAGFQVNDNMQLFITHLQTVAGEDDPVTLQGALFRVTLTWSFHRVIERRRAFSEGA